MGVRFHDNAALTPPSGHFLLKVFRGGSLIETIRQKNLIVTGSKAVHAHLLGGDFGTNNVSQIGYGTNGTAPVVGNAALSGPPYIKALDSVTYPVAGQVQFNFSLASGENNGMAILEFGLYTASNVLYSRIVRATALNKAADISFTGSWTIQF